MNHDLDQSDDGFIAVPNPWEVLAAQPEFAGKTREGVDQEIFTALEAQGIRRADVIRGEAAQKDYLFQRLASDLGGLRQQRELDHESGVTQGPQNVDTRSRSRGAMAAAIIISTNERIGGVDAGVPGRFDQRRIALRPQRQTGRRP